MYECICINVCIGIPTIFTTDRNRDITPRYSQEDVGNNSLPSNAMAPTAVAPEIAFVTAMSGECSAGTTPHMTC